MFQFTSPIDLRLRMCRDGTTLRARIAGPLDAPAVVLLNSLCADVSMWAPQFEALSDRYRVVGFDVRGHGRSDVGDVPFTLDLLVDDLRELVATLDLGRPHLVGLSLGGMIGIAAAARDPDAYASLAVCSALADMPAALGAAWRKRAPVVAASSCAAVVDGSLERWFTPGFAAAQPQTVAAVRAMIAATRSAGYCGVIDVIHDIRLSPLLPQLRLPTQFVVGAEDSASTPAIMGAMCAAVPGARLAVVEGAAHLPTLEQPERIGAILGEFLDAVAR